MIVIDAREHALIEELKKTGQPFAICNLHLGDISISLCDTTNTTDATETTDTTDTTDIKILLERKTYADLVASLKDKRFREQLSRFRASSVPMKGYIIEGGLPFGSVNGIPVSTIDSMLLGLIFRDSLIVVNSRNTAHTAELILKLQSKLPEYLSQDEKDVRDSLIGLSNIKKDNMTPEVCYLSQLAQLPQISTVSAKAIATLFPTMPALITFIQNNKNAISELSNIKVSDRRLGKSIATGIVTYLMGSNTCESIAQLPEKNKIKISLKPKNIE